MKNVTLCTCLIIVFAMVAWSIYITNKKLMHPVNKGKAKEVLIKYLNRLPLQELIHTGKHVDFIEVQENIISSNFEFIETEEKEKFIGGIIKEVAVKGVSVIFEALTSMFGKEGKRPEEGGQLKAFADTHASNPLAIIGNDKNAGAEHFQAGLEGAFPEQGYEESSPECIQEMNQYFAACLTTPHPYATRPFQLNKIHYTHSGMGFKRLKALLRRVKHAQDAGIQLDRAQLLNAAKMVGTSSSSIDLSKSTRRNMSPIRKGFKDSVNYAENLLRSGVQE